ncbi:hypothetical protein [Stenotrophomonas sp. SORGH_AS_0321]|uniref:MoaF-related domain-containing protein n=1 Tax=Stenotrophomonas sp. SORGH_AS_0321 TaxID=3041787 RepID=UPI00286A04FA|nr:hypothetical protein [Stenotrophomonas sp. SORGH_AS_0321]
MSTLLALSAATALASPTPHTHPDRPYPGIGRVVEVDFGENVFELRFDKDGRTMTYVGIRGPELGETETVAYTAIATAPDQYLLYWTEPVHRATVVQSRTGTGAGSIPTSPARDWSSPT